MAIQAYRDLWRVLTRTFDAALPKLPQRYRTKGLEVFFVLSCASLAACQAAYGDYKAGQTSNGVGGQGGGGAQGGGGGLNPGGAGNVGGARGGTTNGGNSSTSACAEKTHQCTDTTIETCIGGKWVGDTSCTKLLCDATTGTCMLCPPGANRCSAFNLQACSSNGTEWATTAQCDTSDYCDAVTNTCFTCLPSEAFCDGASLFKCNATQNGWSITDCGSPDNCDGTEGACVPPCDSPDWVSCNGTSLIGCDANHHHIQLDVCASSQLCTKTINDKISNPTTWTKKCETGCGTPGVYRCNPDNAAELQACPPSGLNWEHVDTCATPALCDPTAKKCDAGCGVAPGTYRCEDSKLELCRADGTGWDLLKTCQDAAHCNTQQHDCVACVPGQYQCSGATLQSCGTDLTWSTVKTCASPALCDATNSKCTPPGCAQAGAWQCSGTSLQQCASDLTGWVTKDTCAASSLCDSTNGRCNPIICTPPTNGTTLYRCQGNTRQQCDTTTYNWKDSNTCLDGQVCDLTVASGCTGTCTSTARCNSTSAQKCTVVSNLPQWQTTATCATAALCSVTNNVASCATPVCDVNQYRCSGNALQKCNADRTGWTTTTTCTSSQICDANLKQCDVCTPSTYTCVTSLNQLAKCSADGLSNPVVDNCPSAVTNNCYTSTDKLTGYCYRCNAGDSQCVGTSQIQTCATDRRSWNTATTCTNGCQDNAGSADYCATCPTAGEVQCVTTASPGSTHTCSSDRKSWSTTAACTQGYGCVDSGTADYCASNCVPNQSSCVTSTSLHVCNSDGKGFAATVSQCADTGSLKACVSGAFSGTSACPSSTPYCVSGACVECTGTSTTCAADGTTLKTCSNGKWVSSTCPSSTPICSGNSCVACTSASAATCTDTKTVKYCASNNTWASQTCTGTTPYCVGGACVECQSSYVATCATAASVQSCSAGKFVTTTCSNATPVCYAASSTTAAVCSACNSSTAPVCLSDGLTLQTCVSGSYATRLCKDVNSATAYCLNGACAGCNASTPATCATSSSLSTCDTTTGTLVTNGCPSATPVCTGSPGKCVQCAPDSARVCTKSNSSNTWYDGTYSCANSTNTSQSCTTGQVCDPTDATCKAATCGVGQAVCASDTTLNTCNATRTGWDSTTCTGACSGGACVTCKPGSTRCNGDTGLETCLSDGSGWGSATSQCADNWSLKACVNNALSSTSTKACPSSAPVCRGGQCVPAACDVGQTQCTADLKGSQVCNTTRTGWTTTTCPSSSPVCQTSTGSCGCSGNGDCAQGLVCSNSQCVAPTCSVNEYHCSGTTLQKCNATQTGWVTVSVCAADTPVCQAATGTCGCSVDGDCGSASLICSGNKCIQAACSVGQSQCSLDLKSSEVCNNTRTGWTVTACPSTKPVCQIATATCGCSANSDCPSSAPVCAANQCSPCVSSTECSGTTPVCSAEGACVACSDTQICPSGACQSDGSCLASPAT